MSANRRKADRQSFNPAARLGASTNRNPLVTPRNSDAQVVVPTAAATETPYGTLRQLANIPAKPSTPLRRASSAGPPSTHRSTRRTPATVIRTPGAATQRVFGSRRRAAAVTPYGRAATREVEARRAGLTPAKDRRRSGRQQRETPRNPLRALSRILAPKSKPIVPTPQGPAPTTRLLLRDELDDLDGPEPERPRLSLPIGDDDVDEDDSLLPPQSAGLEDENYTMKSIELPRRAISEQPPGRLSRASFGSIRMSDNFADLNDLSFGLGQNAFESSFVEQGMVDEDLAEDPNTPSQGDNTATLRGRVSLTSGRNSDIRPTDLADYTETTFVFTVPEGDSGVLEQPLDRLGDQIGDGNEDEQDDDDEGNDFEIIDEFRDADENSSVHDATGHVEDASKATLRKTMRNKKIKVSKHGIRYPSLPAGVVKKLATRFAQTSGSRKTKINKDTLEAIVQASDWFFEQVGGDLGAYAKHAGRKTIDDSDIITLMGRQRQLNANTTPFSLAQKYLPRELLQELRMPAPRKKSRVARLESVEEAIEEDEG